MSKEQLIDAIFNILVQYEHASSPDFEVTEQMYKAYLDRMYVWFVGYGNESVATCIKGLYCLGLNATHDTVKRNVFHMIAILEKEAQYGF